MLCSNFHIHHGLLKDKNKIIIKTFPYLSTLKLKNKSETDLFVFYASLVISLCMRALRLARHIVLLPGLQGFF